MTIFTLDPKYPAACTSSTTATAAYKRSWRDIFIPDCGGMPEMAKTTEKLVGNDVAVEILKNRIPTAPCKSLRKERFGFRTFSTSPAIHYLKRKGNSENATPEPVLI